MPLTILPPWYRSWWALALGLLAGLGAVALAAWSALRRPRQREQRLSLEKQRLERLVAERTSELANANRALERAAVTDLLTGLHNRRYLDERLPSDLARLREERAGGRIDLVHGVLLADLDHFKQINDELGHVAGDRVLEATASLLRQQCRDDDLVVRWGGEEFLIVLRFVTPDEVPRVAERIRAAFEGIRHEGSPRAVTCSLGFALLPLAGAPNEALDVDAAIDLADRCLYLAKQGGRNAWVGIASEAGRQALLEERRGVAEVAAEVRGAVVYRFAPRAA
jgi:diguanylate cyclase (GGDEF)-like protein